MLKQADKLVASLPESVRSVLEEILKDAESSLEDAFDEHLLMTRSVHEILWGYQDNLLKFVADTGINGLPIPSDGTFSLEVFCSLICHKCVLTLNHFIVQSGSFSILFSCFTKVFSWLL